MASASASYRGIQYLLIATTCLGLNDACSKFVVATLPASEIVRLRSLITGIILSAVMTARGELTSLRALACPDIMLRA